MNGYLMHKDICIRLRSGLFDVPLGAAPHTQFIPFGDLKVAKDFIDAGRVPGIHVIFDMATQKAINPLKLS